MKLFKLFAFTFLILSLSLSSIGCKNSGGDEIYDLSNTEWYLDSLYGEMPSAPNGITLSFSDGDVSGTAGCNSYSGGYQQDGNQLTMGPLMSTLMACVDEDVMEQESNFLEALAAIEHVAATEDELTLTTAKGDLIFRPVPPVEDSTLEEVTWVLTSFESGEVAHSVISGTSITITFKAGQVNGSAGCNSFFGEYRLNESQVVFSGLGNTKMACESDIMEQEIEFLTALRAAESFSIEGQHLTLTHTEGALIFKTE